MACLLRHSRASPEQLQEDGDQSPPLHQQHQQAGGRLDDHSAVLAEARPYGRLDVRASRLGLDWIAGLLDNQDPLGDKDEEYFTALAAFRKANYGSCHAPSSTAQRGGLQLRTAGHASREAEAIPAPQPAYRINERLFPEILDMPLDRAADVWGAEYSRFVRISLPQSRIAAQQPVRTRCYRCPRLLPYSGVRVYAAHLRGQPFCSASTRASTTVMHLPLVTHVRSPFTTMPADERRRAGHPAPAGRIRPQRLVRPHRALHAGLGVCPPRRPPADKGHRAACVHRGGPAAGGVASGAAASGKTRRVGLGGWEEEGKGDPDREETSARLHAVR